MKSLLSLLISCVATLAYAQDDFQSAFSKINNEVQSNSRAYVNLREATETIGHRLTGSANGVRAEELAFKLLKSYGFDVKFQPFEVESWSRISNETKIGDDENTLTKITSVTLAHSPVNADVTAEIVDLGNGLASDYQLDSGKVKGKIALVYLGVLPGSPPGTQMLHRSEKAAIATKHGAVGIIIINAVKGGVLLTGTASVTGKLIPIPAVCIGFENGMRIKDKLKKQKQYGSLSMVNFSGTIKARNVIATLKGSALPEEKIIVGAHLDSWDLATGAIDNGIGAFAVIDIARTFRKLQLTTRRTVEFVLFMGEEQGLLGSKAYVEAAKHSNALEKIRFMLNYDMTNDPIGFSTSRKEMQDLFAGWGSQIAQLDSGFKNTFLSGAWLHSDHQPFMLQGIPVGGGAGGNLPNNAVSYYHSNGDVFKLVDEQGLKNTVRYSAMLAYALANTTVIPVSRHTEAELKMFLQENDLETPLKIAGEWRW